MPKLVITDNEGSRTVALNGEIKAGRLADNDIQLKVPEASRHHCRFLSEQGSWFVEDLGSSNGTLVNGRKVSKFELQDGDLISVGAVTMRFLDAAAEPAAAAGGWGADEISLDDDDPFEPAPAAVVDAAVEPDADVDAPLTHARRETTVMDDSSAFSDPSFELGDIVEEKRSPVGSILAVALLVALAGGLVWLYLNRDVLEGGERGRRDAGDASKSNMIPARFASFEAADEAFESEETEGWHKEDPGDFASTGVVRDPVRTGENAWSIARRESDKPEPPTWVSLTGGPAADISVTPGETYRLSGFCFTDSAGVVPALAVSWLEPVTGDEPRVVAREVAAGPSGQRGWAEISGVVQAPESATRARIGLVAGGVGEAVFDDLSFNHEAQPGGRGVETQGYHAWLTPDGALRLFHFSRAVSDGVGIWKQTPRGLEPPWLAQNAAVRVALTAGDKAFQVRFDLGGASPEHVLAIPLPGGADDVNVTLFDGDRARRMRAAFEAETASGVIVGGHGDRVRMRFQDDAGQPFQAPLRVVVQGGRALLVIDRGARDAIALQCDVSFDAEMAQARDLMARANEASGSKQYGTAMALYEDVLARFPFDEATERQASSQLERLMNDGRKSIKDLTTRVDDAKFFRTARIDDALLADLKGEAARYAGTRLEAEFKAKLEEFEGERARTAAERNDAQAQAAFQRALDYLDMKQGRREVAIALLQMVATRYEPSEWAAQARDMLEKMKAR